MPAPSRGRGHVHIGGCRCRCRSNRNRGGNGCAMTSHDPLARREPRNVAGGFLEVLFGARSAAGSMTPLSLTYAAARTQIPVAPLPQANHGAHLAGASSRFLLPTFLCGGKEK